MSYPVSSAGANRLMRGAELRFERIRQALVAELCAGGVGEVLGRGQLAGALAFSPASIEAGAAVYRFTDRAVALWAKRSMGAHVRHGEHGLSCLVLTDWQMSLRRLGYHGRGSWSFGLDVESTVGVVRGILLTAATFSEDGLSFTCGSAGRYAAARGVLARAGIACTAVGDSAVLVDVDDVAAVLRFARVTGAGGAWQALLEADQARAVRRDQKAAARRVRDRERMALVGPKSDAQLEREAVFRAREHRRIAAGAGSRLAVLHAPRVRNTQPLVVQNSVRSHIAAEADVRRIQALGDLDELVLPETLRQAARIRVERPELTMSELAEELQISRNTYTGRLRRFFARVDKQTEVHI